MLNIFLSGKTVISKEQAIRKASEDKSKPVYYISMVASDRRGKPEKRRYIFDILTEWFDLKTHKNTTAIPRDVTYLMNFYKNYRTAQDSSDPNVYEMAEFYIKRNPNAHFIFDEVPILPFYYGRIIFKVVYSLFKQCKQTLYLSII